MAKKKAPQRLAGAEESCISPEQEAIIQDGEIPQEPAGRRG